LRHGAVSSVRESETVRKAGNALERKRSKGKRGVMAAAPPP
jgi:hypothetical protein